MSTYEKTLREAIQKLVLTKGTPERPIITLDGTRTVSWIFDFRAAMCHAEYLDAYAEVFWDTFENAYPFQVCGMETAGIALVAAICMKGTTRGKKVNGLYIRKSRKKHGLMKALEGMPSEHPVIFVDDLINSGQSLEKCITVLKDHKLTLTHVFTILSLRDPRSYSFLEAAGVKFSTLFRSDEFGVELVKSETPLPPHPYEVLWKIKSHTSTFQYVVPKSAPVVDDGHIYMGSDDGYMHAFDYSGKEIWSFRIGAFPLGKGIFSTPIVSNNVVFFGGYDGNVYALHASDGSRKWVYRDADWIGSSPSIAPHHGLLFIGLEFGLFKRRGGIAALDIETGKEVWAMRIMSDFTHSSPLFIPEEEAVVIGNNDGSVYCFEARSGKRRWERKTDGSVKASFAYLASQRLIVFGSFDGHIYALDAVSGSLRWKYSTGEAVYATPCINNNVIYIPSLNKSLYAIDELGKELWRFETRGRIFASPVIAAGSLWIGSNDGRLYEIDPLKGKLRSSFQTSERIVNAIAYDLATNTIFLPTQANELYCIKKRA